MEASTTIRVHQSASSERNCEVKWYGRVSDDHVRVLVTSALGIPVGTDIVGRVDQKIVALNGALPDGVTVAIATATTAPTRAFRRQLIKFENIQAHLANERTFLAWARTALSSLSIAYSLLSLVSEAEATWLQISLYLVGSAFVVSVLTTFLTGWLRFARVRDVLTMAKLSSKHVIVHFHRIGLSHQAFFLAALCVLLTAIYLAGGAHLIQ